MHRLTYFGIDWADSKHDVCIQPSGVNAREFDGHALGASTLIQDNKGATGTIHVGDLPSDVQVFSVWALAFNNPGAMSSVHLSGWSGPETILTPAYVNCCPVVFQCFI